MFYFSDFLNTDHRLKNPLQYGKYLIISNASSLLISPVGAFDCYFYHLTNQDDDVQHTVIPLIHAALEAEYRPITKAEFDSLSTETPQIYGINVHEHVAARLLMQNNIFVSFFNITDRNLRALLIKVGNQYLVVMPLKYD